MKAFIAAAALLLAVQSASAEGITLSFDGMNRSFIPQMDGARTGFTRFDRIDAISIEGADGAARLVIEMSFLAGARRGDQPHDARISYRPDGWRDYWVSPPVFPQGALTVDGLDLSSLEPRISGSFSVPLCFARSVVDAPNLDHCQTATGRFSTLLVRD